MFTGRLNLLLSIYLLLHLSCSVTSKSAKSRRIERSNKPRGYELNLVRQLVGKSYTKLAKPSQMSENQTFTVKTRLYLIRIQQVDEASETFHSSIRLQLSWIDPKLSWFPPDFGGLGEIVVPGGYLWVPPLHIANGVDETDDVIRYTSDFPFRVQSDGKVWYHPTGKSSTRCKFDLTYYPFDYQRCLIIIESEIYQEKELMIITRADDKPGAISFGMLAENEVWELIPEYTFGYPKIYQSGRSTAFSRVHFVIAMKRKPAFFVVTIVVPTVILALITILTYLVPIHYVDRPVQSVTTVLAIAIFESTVAEKLPTNSANCILTNYLTIIMCSSAITILTTTVCLAVVDPGEFIKAPWGLPNIAGACFRAFRSIPSKLSSKGSTTKSIREIEDDFDHDRIQRVFSGGIEINPIHRQDSNMSIRQRRSRPQKSRRVRLGSYPIRTALRVLKRQQRVPLVAKKKPYEPGRRLLTEWQSWYVAYAVNWIGFSISVLATVSLPLMALINKPIDDAAFMSQLTDDNSNYYASQYYGDS